MTIRPLCLGLALAAGLSGATGRAAFAHAFLTRAEPPVGGTVAVSPEKIRLWFSEPIEGAFSRIEISDRAGPHSAFGPAAVAKEDPTELDLAVPKLAPGRYRVVWRAVSVDTHVTSGAFDFMIGP